MKYFTFVAMAFRALGACEKDGEILNEAKTHLEDCERISIEKGVEYQKFIQGVWDSVGSFRTPQEAIQFAQEGFPFDHRDFFSSSLAAAFEVDFLLEFPKTGNLIALMEEPRYSTSHVIDWKGRSVSNIFYFHCWPIFRSLSLIDEPKIVCDLGSGYGFSAYLWMKNPLFSPNVMILLDFAESLFFAEIFLKCNLPNVDVLYLRNSDLSELDLSKKTILLCPIGQEENLFHLPIDLVINCFSLQQMSDGWVDHWMQWLDRSQARYFYSLNFGAVPLPRRHPICQGATDYSYRLSKNWGCLFLSGKAPFGLKDPYSGEAGVVEMVAERGECKESREEIQNRFYSVLEKKLDRERFVECLDIWRLCLDEEMAWELVSRSLQDMIDSVPQEVRYLVRMLQQNGSASFLEARRERLKWAEKFLNGYPH